nr:ATP-binding cassette domain-containing protein [Streptomyces sp. NBC_00830]
MSFSQPTTAPGSTSEPRRAANPSSIRIIDVEQRFTPPNRPAFNALEAVSFDVGATEFCSIVGPSGCGKSTVLNMVAGLLQPTSGRIEALGKTVQGVNTEVGYVTQDSNLLPWLTVAKNIELPLQIRGLDGRTSRYSMRSIGMTVCRVGASTSRARQFTHRT